MALTQAALVDEEGFIIDLYVVEEEDNSQPYITSEIPQGLFRARWTGVEWVEGESDEEKAEREVQQLLESLKPSPSEIADAELEIKMITLLSELEAI